MWLPISPVCSSRISSQLFRLFLFSFSSCMWWFGIFCLLFLFLVVNFLPSPVIVVISHVSRLLEGEGRIGGSFRITWVQLSQQEYFFPLHLANPRNCVDSIFSSISQLPLNCVASVSSTLFVMVNAMDHLPSLLCAPFLLPPSVFRIIVWTGGLAALDVWCSTYPLVS